MRNQFGDLSVDTIKADYSSSRRPMDPMNPPPAPNDGSHNVNHYKCYKVKVTGTRRSSRPASR